MKDYGLPLLQVPIGLAVIYGTILALHALWRLT
jgi:hypothetical protein